MNVIDWFGHVANIVYGWGYIGVFLALVIEGLGLPFPGDAVMAFYGVSAAAGRFHPVTLIVVSFLGYLTGAITGYAVSLRFGSVWMDKMLTGRWLNQRSMMRTSSLLDRYGPMLLVPGRFLPGVRSVSSYVAGALRMAFSPFVFYTSLGVVAWCALWILTGYWFGEHLDFVMSTIKSSLTYVTVGVAVLLVFAFAWRRARRT